MPGVLAVIEELSPFIVTGLATGSVYAIAAMGLVLTYKTSGIFNFAHGAQAALGAYLMWDLWERHHWPWPVAGAAALLLAGVGGGLALERVARALADKPGGARIVAAVGVLVALQGLLTYHYGTAVISMDYFLPTTLVSVGSTNVRYEQLIVVVLAALTAIGLALFFRRSRLGVAMQAVVDEPDLLDLTGTSAVAVRRSAWMVGSCFAAASGALLAPTLGLDAVLLTLLVVQAFGAAAIGRFSSLPLTYVGGLAVGVGQELLKYVVSRDALAERVSPMILQPLPSNLPFLVLFGVLVFAGRSQFVERGARVIRQPRPVARLPRTLMAVGGVASGAALLAVPHVVGTRLPIYMSALAFATLFASLVLLVRISGQVSLCQMSFAAIGSAAAAHLTSAGLPFPAAIALGGLVTVPFGALIAIPAIRLSGVFLAIATFGFGILVERLLFPTALLFGADQGVEATRPAFARSDVGYYNLLLLVAVGAGLIVVAVRRGRLGRLVRGLAEAPAAIPAHGASANVVRTMVFCLSAFIAGVAGGMMGPITGTTSGGIFNFGVSLTIVAVLYLAGARPLVSAFVAAFLYQVLPGYVTDDRLTELLPVLFGVAAVAAACGVGAWARQLVSLSPRIARRAYQRSPAKTRARRLPAAPVEARA